MIYEGRTLLLLYKLVYGMANVPFGSARYKKKKDMINNHVKSDKLNIFDLLAIHY
jgi:hypothetical protein